MTVTRNTLRKWNMRLHMALDADDFYENTYVCVQQPRLMLVTNGPKGTRVQRRKHERKHTKTWRVDGVECKDVEEAIVRLNRGLPTVAAVET